MAQRLEKSKIQKFRDEIVRESFQRDHTIRERSLQLKEYARKFKRHNSAKRSLSIKKDSN